MIHSSFHFLILSYFFMTLFFHTSLFRGRPFSSPTLRFTDFPLPLLKPCKFAPFEQSFHATVATALLPSYYSTPSIHRGEKIFIFSLGLFLPYFDYSYFSIIPIILITLIFIFFDYFFYFFYFDIIFLACLLTE